MSDLIAIPTILVIVLVVIAAAVATEVVTAILPTIVLAVLVPADERADLAALVQATRGRHRHTRTLAAVWVGVVAKARARAVRRQESAAGWGPIRRRDEPGPASPRAGVHRIGSIEGPVDLPGRPADQVVPPVPTVAVPASRPGGRPRGTARMAGDGGYRWP